MPPADWPESVRGQEYKVVFWIDERGRVRRVEVEPRIQDSDYRKKFLDTLEEKDQKACGEAFSAYCSVLDKAAKKGVIKKNTAIRRKSRAAGHLAAL